MLRRNSAFLFIAVGLYILLRLLDVTKSDLWYDEVFSVLTVRQGWAEMFSAVIKDGVHPPLFYILLKLWSVASSSVWWLQMFPLLISVLTLLPFYLLCRALKLTVSEMAVAFLAVAVNGYFLEYALDLRMYGLLQFFTLCSLWLFVESEKSDEAKQSILRLLALFNLLLVYTHYFGWLVVGLEGLYLIVWRRRLAFSYAVSSTGVLLCFVPWIWLVLRNAASNNAMGNLDWLTRPSPSDALWFYTVLNGSLNVRHTTAVSFLIFALPVGYLIWRSRRRDVEDSSGRFLIFFAFAPVILVFLLSNALPKSVWESRYLIIAAVPYCVLFVKSAFALPTRNLRFIFISFILIWSLTTGFYNFSQPPDKIQWSEAARKIGNSNQPVYAFDEWVVLPLQFYLSESKSPAQVEKRGGLDEIRDKNFWAVFRVPMSNDTDEVRENLRAKKCRIVQESIFSGGSQSILLFYVEDCL